MVNCVLLTLTKRNSVFSVPLFHWPWKLEAKLLADWQLVQLLFQLRVLNRREAMCLSIRVSVRADDVGQLN